MPSLSALLFPSLPPVPPLGKPLWQPAGRELRNGVYESGCCCTAWSRGRAMGGPESGQAGDAALSHTPHVPSAVKTLEGPVPSRSLKEPTHRFKNSSGESRLLKHLASCTICHSVTHFEAILILGGVSADGPKVSLCRGKSKFCRDILSFPFFCQLIDQGLVLWRGPGKAEAGVP